MELINLLDLSRYLILLNMKTYYIIFILITNLLTLCGQNTGNQEFSSGPGKGTLIIIGGGEISESLNRKIIEISGGLQIPIVVIPTADGRENYDENFGEAGLLRKMGATNVTVLHTNDRNVANTEEFVRPLLEAKLVWFSGGRQWRLVDSYKNTLTEKMLWKVLENGGTIGGSSAGATIQGSFLVRGDTKNNQIMMGDHQEGFGFLRNVAIDQHVLARNRQFDMFEILRKRPELLGIGIDESTAIIVKGEIFEVVGKSYVVVYDGKFWSREGSEFKKIPEEGQIFYFLREGDRYNLRERKIVN
jgi:cyanophycinase